MDSFQLIGGGLILLKGLWGGVRFSVSLKISNLPSSKKAHNTHLYLKFFSACDFFFFFFFSLLDILCYAFFFFFKFPVISHSPRA